LKTSLRIPLIILLTIALVALFLWNSSPAEVWKHLRSTQLGWFLLGLTANFCALLCRVERWRSVLSLQKKPPFYPTFLATALGFMSSALLPVRAGEVIRPALLSRRTDIRFSTAFGTVMLEKLLDLFTVLTLFAIFVFTSGQEFASRPETAARFGVVRVVGFVAVGAIIVLVIAAVGVYFFQDRLRRLHETISRIVPRRFRDSWMRIFDSFVRSLAMISQPRAFARVLLFTGGIWFFLSSQFFLVALAMRHPLPFTASFFVTGVTILGLLFPTPGGVGGFHKACQIALTGFYGFGLNASIAFAVVFHLVGTAPVIITGLVLFAREGLSWRQLIRIGEKVEE
jgi:glycosyltransferase 2 family protein